jgi:hypothetical protein
MLVSVQQHTLVLFEMNCVTPPTVLVKRHKQIVLADGFNQYKMACPQFSSECCPEPAKNIHCLLPHF